MPNLSVHLEDITQYKYIGILLDTQTSQGIRSDLIEKFGSLQNSKEQLKMSRMTLSCLGKTHIKIFNLQKICRALNKSINDLEASVISITSKDTYPINFPYNLTPLHFRVVSHIIGDGNYTNGSACWIQKDATPLLNLQNLIFKNRHNCRTTPTGEKCTILNVYLRLVSSALKIRPSQLKTSLFLEKALQLPKEYRVQILAAITEYEGTIQSKSCTSRIAISNKSIISSIANLIDSLGYQRSAIFKRENNGFCSFDLKGNPIYSIHLNVLGVHRFYQDLNDVTRRYGLFALLWKKQRNLEEYIRLNNGQKAIGMQENRERIRLIYSKWDKPDISRVQIRHLLGLNNQQANSLIRRMSSEGLMLDQKEVSTPLRIRL